MAQVISISRPRARSTPGPLVRVLTYSATRLAALFITVVIGVYLTILVANMGGYVDVIKKAAIREQVGFQVSFDPMMRRLSFEQRQARIQELIRIEEQTLGLDRPFLVRSVVYLQDALALRLGFAERMTSDTGSRLVKISSWTGYPRRCCSSRPRSSCSSSPRCSGRCRFPGGTEA